MSNEEIALARFIQPGTRKMENGWLSYALVVLDCSREEPIIESDPFTSRPKVHPDHASALDSARDFVSRLRSRQHKTLRELAREALNGRQTSKPSPGVTHGK